MIFNSYFHIFLHKCHPFKTSLPQKYKRLSEKKNFWVSLHLKFITFPQILEGVQDHNIGSCQISNILFG